jgi:hypothetical protein
MTMQRFLQHQHALTRWYAAYCTLRDTKGLPAATLFRLHAAETEPLSPAWEYVTRPTQSHLWCCDHWIPIVTMPLRCLRCGRVWLARWPEAKGTAA